MDGAYVPTHFVGMYALLRTGTRRHAKELHGCTTRRLRDILSSSFVFIDIPGSFGLIWALQYLTLSTCKAALPTNAQTNST